MVHFLLDYFSMVSFFLDMTILNLIFFIEHKSNILYLHFIFSGGGPIALLFFTLLLVLANAIR